MKNKELQKEIQNCLDIIVKQVDRGWTDSIPVEDTDIEYETYTNELHNIFSYEVQKNKKTISILNANKVRNEWEIEVDLMKIKSLKDILQEYYTYLKIIINNK